MPYKVFSAGEEALASDANSYLMSQTVARFASASQRTSQLTSPATNQLSMLDDRPGVIQRYSGSAWVDMPLSLERSVFLSPAAIVAAAQEFTLASFTLPFSGVVLISGQIRTDPGAGATSVPINVLIDAGPTSAPAWAVNPQWVGPTQPANAYYGDLPFAFKTVPTAAGTTCTIKIQLRTNAAMGAQVTWIQASIRIVPSEF